MNMVFRVPIQGFTSIGLSAHVTKPSSWVQMTTVLIVRMVNPFLFQEKYTRIIKDISLKNTFIH